MQVFAHHVGFKLVFFLYEPLVVLHARHIGRHVLPRRSYLSYCLAHLRQDDNINRHSDREENNRIHHRGRESITNDALHENARLFGHMHFRRHVPFARGSRMFGLVGTGLVFRIALHGLTTAFFGNAIANAPYGLDELFRRIDLGELFAQATNIDHDCIVRRRRVFLVPYVFEQRL